MLSFQTMVDVIPADSDDIPSNILNETWELPFTDDCSGMELVGSFFIFSAIDETPLSV